MKLNRNILPLDSTIKDALQKLNSLTANEMTLFVVDDLQSMKVVGTLTNGDVRRALLDGINICDSVSKAMFTDFKRLYEDNSDQVSDIAVLRQMGIMMVPVVDRTGRLVEILDLNKQPTRLPLKAILMAGGKGERLRPLTLTTPKPLLEIGGKAIIDYNIDALIHVGINDITVCAGYMADKIASHLKDKYDGLSIDCVAESKPLGTIGAVSQIKLPIGGKTLIMNSDLLTSVSFEEMYLKHKSTGAKVTVGVVPYQVSVPYAILNVEGETVRSIEEKPAYSHYANAGIYIFDNEILSEIKSGARTDAPDVIRYVIESGGNVSYYVINGTWIDIGSPTDFTQAQDLMRHHRNLSGFNGGN